ncbi:DUF6053 domain-containing protein [Lysobacter enzymogenes]|uniref:DUF6053 domain-containing protein n=1 Tax=Lysobacter enzymogenes TaxID=69 RepID=UPI003747DE94
MGGPSGPMPSGPFAANWNKSVGPEGPPTRAAAWPSWKRTAETASRSGVLALIAGGAWTSHL